MMERRITEVEEALGLCRGSYDEGYDEGKTDGYKEGFETGQEEGKSEERSTIYEALDTAISEGEITAPVKAYIEDLLG